MTQDISHDSHCTFLPSVELEISYHPAQNKHSCGWHWLPCALTCWSDGAEAQQAQVQQRQFLEEEAQAAEPAAADPGAAEAAPEVPPAAAAGEAAAAAPVAPGAEGGAEAGTCDSSCRNTFEDGANNHKLATSAFGCRS